MTEPRSLEPTAAAEAPSAEQPAARSRARGCLLEAVETIVATLVIFIVLQTFVAQPFKVEQTSMESTFLENDYVLVDRLSHLWSPYAAGQVIVFQPPATFPDGGKPLIKRIIAVGGDTVEIRDGAVFVNGVRRDEPYLHRGSDGAIEPTKPTPGGEASWLVPAGDLFVMGDHRLSSSDSRRFGPIPVSSVIGRGFVRYWPLDRFGLIVAPTY